MGKQPLKLLTKVTQKAKNDTKFKEKHQQDEQRLVQKKTPLLRIQLEFNFRTVSMV